MERRIYSITTFTYLLELKEVELGELQTVKEQIVTAALTKLSPSITFQTLDKIIIFFSKKAK